MLNRTLAIGLLVATGLAGTLCARAADMPALFPAPSYEDAEPPPQMEWGTGWYLRGDVAASDEINPSLLAAVPSRSRDWGFAVGGGAGYQFNDYFRADITGDYLGTQKASLPQGLYIGPNGPYTAAKATLDRWDALVNGYVNLGSWGGLTPYVGAGVGVAGLNTVGSYTDLSGAQFKLGGQQRYNLAWAAMAGVAYSLAPHLMLDVGYRYLDLGTYRAPQGTAIQQGVYSPQNIHLTAHAVRVGVRYQID
jgi:opacity protein-like surface antigen